MCTAATFKTRNHYFGRNFDYEISYDEEIIIFPRNFNLEIRHEDDLNTHNAIVGIAAGMIKDYPLFYDAVNEKGLAMGGLNFQDYAVYSNDIDDSKNNICEFEFIPYILGKCDTLEEARKEIEGINLLNESFSKNLPLSPLHWMLADTTGKSIVVEATKDGLNVYDNPVGILTNSPNFDLQLFNLNNYLKVSNREPETSSLGKDVPLNLYSRGMGGIGLPGDYSSMSRFVKAVFVKENSYVVSDDEVSGVNQFFHILGSVEQPKGCTLITDPDKYEYTIYSSCMDLDESIYYYKTYDNFSISKVALKDYDLDGKDLTFIPLNKETF